MSSVSGALPINPQDDQPFISSGSALSSTIGDSNLVGKSPITANPESLEAKKPLKMEVEPFRLLLAQISYQENGDKYEKSHSSLIIKRMPNNEIFWREFVVPLTERINGYPEKPTDSIKLRSDVDNILLDIAAIHYSLFLNLVYAHIHLEEQGLSWLENFYTHLGSSCDLAESFLEKWYFLLLQFTNQESRVLQKLTRREFQVIAGKWYDEHYKDLFQYYLSRGKQPPISLINKTGQIIKEFLSAFLKHDKLWKRYVHLSSSIRQFRNAIVHDVQIAKLIDLDSNLWMPRPKVIGKYRTWREVSAVAGSVDIIKRDFVLPLDQARTDLDELESVLNDIWGIVITRLETEFYNPRKTALQKLYQIEFVISARNGAGKSTADE